MKQGMNEMRLVRIFFVLYFFDWEVQIFKDIFTFYYSTGGHNISWLDFPASPAKNVTHYMTGRYGKGIKIVFLKIQFFRKTFNN